MCGRIFVKNTLAGLMSAFSFASPGDAEGLGNESHAGTARSPWQRSGIAGARPGSGAGAAHLRCRHLWAERAYGDHHDHMPVILQREDCERWLGSDEDRCDLMKPFPADQMTMWPIGKKVGAYANNTPDILDPPPAGAGEGRAAGRVEPRR